MNRRGFLGALLSAALAPLAGALVVKGLAGQVGDHLTLEKLRAAVAVLKASNGSFVAFVHPDHYIDLIAFNRRGEWDSAYRRARKAGDGQMSPREILVKYPVDVLRPEIGRYENVRFVTSEAV